MEDVKKEKEQNKEGRTPTIVGFLILAIIMAFTHAIVRQPANQPHWNNYSMGASEPHLRITLPAAPQQKTIDIPQQVRDMIQKIESHECTSSSTGISVLVINAVYKNQIIPSIEGAVDGALSNIKNLKGISNIQHTISHITVSGKNGKLLTVSADQDGRRFEMKGLFLIDGSQTWQIIVEYGASSKNGREAAQRVIDSVSF